MLRFLTAGESHGPELVAIVEGVPSGFEIDRARINEDLARRQKGYGRGGRMVIERDEARIVSGVRFGRTLGSPVTLVIENKDFRSWQKYSRSTYQTIRTCRSMLTGPESILQA